MFRTKFQVHLKMEYMSTVLRMSQVGSSDIAIPCRNNPSHTVRPMLKQDPEIVSGNLTDQKEALEIHKEAYKRANFWRELFGWGKESKQSIECVDNGSQ